MVVFVDFDDDALSKHGFAKGPDAFQHPYVEPGKPVFSKLRVGFDLPPTPSEGLLDAASSEAPSTSDEEVQPIANRNAFSAALSCYPYESL
jgi:hypothetical protein